MTSEMKAFTADVLESIKQAKRGEFAKVNTHADIAQISFIEHLLAIPKTQDETAAEYEAKRLSIQQSSIDLGESTNN